MTLKKVKLFSVQNALFLITDELMRTQEAFTISILDCARRVGLKFSRNYTNREGQTEHIFHSPLRKDKNASIYISEAKNVWYDNGGIIDGGGIVRFINYLYGNPLKDTKSALQVLDRIYPELNHPSKIASHQQGLRHIGETLPLFKNNAISQKNYLPAGRYNKEENKPSTFEVVEVKDLYSYPLKNYLKDARRINIEIAKLYVKEVIYKHTAKNMGLLQK